MTDEQFSLLMSELAKREEQYSLLMAEMTRQSDLLQSIYVCVAFFVVIGVGSLITYFILKPLWCFIRGY